MTGRQLIAAALRKANIYAPNQVVTSADETAAFTDLGLLLASWQAEGLMVPFVTIETFNLAAGTSAYTIGTSGAPSLNTSRPELIVGAYVRDSGGYDYRVDILGEREYRRYSHKAATGRPNTAWYNATVPNGTLYVYPTPDTIEAFYIHTEKPFAEPATVTASVVIPRGYDLALVANLAVMLSSDYDREPSPLLLAAAAQLKANLKAVNMARTVQPAAVEVMQSAGTGRFNVLEG